jgi:competence protein ComEC
MFSCLSLSLGIIVAQLLNLTNLHAVVLLVVSLISYMILNYRLRSLSNLKLYHYSILWLSLILLGLAYSSLRINQRMSNLLEQSISHFYVDGHLISPIQTQAGYNQVIIKIDSGSFTGRNLKLYFPPNVHLDPQYNYQFLLNLHPLKLAHNVAGFDYQQYLISQNITATANLIAPPQIIARNYSLAALINQQRISLINYLQQVLTGQQYAGLIIALVTGYQNLITDAQWQVFRNSGITHIVSISGLHITLVAAIVVFILNFILLRLPPTRIPRQIILAWCGVSVALAYSLLAGFSIPTQRTFFQLLVMAYLLSRRHYLSLLHKLAITLVLVLVLDPWASLSIGFWFSFTIVATIFACMSSYQQFNYSKFKLWLRLNFFITVVGFPLSLYLFASFPLISVVANLWAIPLIGDLFTPFLVISSLLHLTWLIKLASFSLDYLLMPIEYLAQFNQYWQGSPSLSTILLSYLGIVLLLLPQSFKAKNILGFALFGSLFMLDLSNRPNYGSFRIINFTNPQSGISLIQTKRYNIVVSASSSESASLIGLKTTLLPYLLKQHQTQIDYVISNYANESQIQELLLQSQIKLINLKSKQQLAQELDGVSLNYQWHQHDFALIMRDHAQQLSYLGTGYAPTKLELNYQNIIIDYPLTKLSWLYQTNITNLVINYPPSYLLSAQSLFNNLNLNAQSSYALPEVGSVKIEEDGVASIAISLAKPD